MDPIRAIQTQIDVSDAQAQAALTHTQGNVSEAILYLYNIPPPPEKPKTEWDERRNICDAYEETMYEFVRRNSVLQPGTGVGGAAGPEPIRVIPKPKKAEAEDESEKRI